MPEADQNQHHDHSLPPQLTPLIGREHDVAAVRQMVIDCQGHLVTLTGVAGCGKTRLALQVGLDLENIFRDGVWLVELAPLADPLLIPQAVARAVGLTEQPGRPMLHTLVADLGSRHLLLVLDNCEHLVEGCASLAETLLKACPDLRVLATSREPLRVTAEVVWPIAPLAVPEARQLPVQPAEATQFAAVELFLERARAAQPAFALTRDNAAAVSRICVRLDGLPLALELAAARVGVLTAEQITARLDDIFRILPEGSRTAPSRRHTLRATFDWSYGLLSPADEALFRRLGVFAGYWTLETAEVVCAGDGIEAGDALGLLARLVDRSLVVSEADPLVSGAMRYRLLEPTGQYALNQLQVAGEAAATERRHTAYFLGMATEGEALWRGPWEMGWLEQIDREQDNLRAALIRTLENRDMEAHLLL